MSRGRGYICVAVLCVIGLCLSSYGGALAKDPNNSKEIGGVYETPVTPSSRGVGGSVTEPKTIDVEKEVELKASGVQANEMEKNSDFWKKNDPCVDFPMLPVCEDEVNE